MNFLRRSWVSFILIVLILDLMESAKQTTLPPLSSLYLFSVSILDLMESAKQTERDRHPSQ